MKKYLRYGAALLALLQAACSQMDFAAVNLPTWFGGGKTESGIAYGPRPDEKLDIYFPPDSDPAARYPVVVFFYGGRWETGDKADYAFVGAALARQNFIVVIPDYRKYPQVKFPAFVEDAAAAIAWTHDHIADYGGDPSQLNVAGHSAGGHIAALAVTDPRYLAAYDLPRSIIHSFVGMAGPYDFTPDEPDLIDMFGPPSRYPHMQVTTYVDGREPPMLLLQGDQDTIVKPSNLDRLAAAISRKNGCVKTKIYPGIDHVWLVGSLSWLGKSNPPILPDMVDFFRDPVCR